jgi:hypothetical protein
MDKAKYIAASAAAETVITIPRRGNEERSRLFIMEWTTRLEIDPSFFKSNVGCDNIMDRKALFDLFCR